MPPADSGAVRVKICGLSDAETVEASAAAGAEWVGFVFFARSPRCVTPDHAASLQRSLPSAVGSVALLVKPSNDEIARVLDVLPVAALQIYDEPDRCVAIRDRFGVPVWRAIGVSTAADLPDASTLDALVIESQPPAGADRPGGNGIGFDWRIAREWLAPVPWLLAGGLRPDTVGAAVLASGARAVDVSSGVESAPGRKDPNMIRAFIAAARGAS